MVNPEETARLHRAVATLRKPKHSLHSNSSLSQTARSILHPSLSTAIQLTRRTDRINGRKILNLNFVFFFGIHDPEIKKDGLIIYGGRDIADLEDSLPDVETTDPPTDDYKKFIRKLDKYFLPKKNIDYARFQVGNLRQEEDESLAKYFARVREIAKKFEYHDENDAIRDHLIKTMRNRRIRVKAIRQGWTLQEILDEAAIDEETNHQANEVEKKISHDEKDVKRIAENRVSKPYGRCGRKHTQKCPALGAVCTACGKRNHYANVCRSKPQETKGYRPQQDKTRYPNGPRNRRDP